MTIEHEKLRAAIKPLEWSEHGPQHSARAAVTNIEYAAAPSAHEDFKKQFRLRGPWIGFRYYLTMDAAKSAAETDHKSRILAAFDLAALPEQAPVEARQVERPAEPVEFDHQQAMRVLTGCRCKACNGSGEQNDAEAGDISHRSWECGDCGGMGWDRRAYSEAFKLIGTVPLGETVTEAARDVLAERQRQVSAEGWTPEYDDEHTAGELAVAGAEYAAHAGSDDDERAQFPAGKPSDMWPWHREWWKPSDPRRELVKAGALILAEIERLDRAAVTPQEPPYA